MLAGKVFAQKIEDELFSLLRQGKYHELVNKTCSLREKEYFKNAFMDYCLAYGYCQLNKPSLSREWFDHLLVSYNNLSTNKRNELRKLKESCINTNTTVRPTNALFSFLRGMSPEGFEGNSSGIESKMGITSVTDTVKEFDFEHLTFDAKNRKFTKKQKEEALAYYRNLIAKPAFSVDTTDHFLVFYPNNALAIKNHLKQLEEYYSYYNLTFNLNNSDRLITVFYCTNREDFTEVAERLHKIPVPKSTFGYASSADLVMLGIANAAWLGAMKHELFHLVIRSFIGDIPAWLDEGTACYFESSNLHGNIATTNFSWTNYRVNLLRRMDYVRSEIRSNQKTEISVPSLKQLTNYNWQEFSGISGDLMIKASLHQSLSYAFVSYLNEKKLLSKTIEAFRNRAFIEAPTALETNGLTILHLRTNDEILKMVTGMNEDEIQLEFKQWCKQKNILFK